MDHLQPQDPRQEPAQRVAFGPREDDDMPLSWAQNGLTWLKETRPSVFADMMLAVLGVERARGRKPGA